MAYAYYITHTKPSLHMILQWHNVFVCTLLHRELLDYSLGQITFAVFFEH